MLDRSETLCPTTAEVCPALVNLQRMYVGNADRVDPDTASRDRDAYTPKRLEHMGAAIVRRCDGVTEADTCPVRDAMDVSPVRKSLAVTVRALLRLRATS